MTNEEFNLIVNESQRSQAGRTYPVEWFKEYLFGVQGMNIRHTREEYERLLISILIDENTYRDWLVQVAMRHHNIQIPIVEVCRSVIYPLHQVSRLLVNDQLIPEVKLPPALRRFL